VTKGYVALVNEVLGESKQAVGADCPEGLHSRN
jgi:hypothetical protein